MSGEEFEKAANGLRLPIGGRAVKLLKLAIRQIGESDDD